MDAAVKLPDENAYGWGLDTSANSDFVQAINRVVERTQPRRFIHLGRTPMVLQIVGMQDMRVTINTDVIQKAIGQQIGLPHPRENKPPHNVEVNVLKGLMKEINNPVAIFETINPKDNSIAYAILTDSTEIDSITGKEKGLTAFVHINKDSHNVIVAKIASIYGRNISQIQKAIDDKEILYLNTEKGQQISWKFGVQFPSVVTNSADLLELHIRTEKDLRQALLEKIEKEQLLNQKFDLQLVSALTDSATDARAEMQHHQATQEKTTNLYLPKDLPLADREVGKLAYEAIAGDMNKLPQLKAELAARGYQFDERHLQGINHPLEVKDAFGKAVSKQPQQEHNLAKAKTDHQR